MLPDQAKTCTQIMTTVADPEGVQGVGSNPPPSPSPIFSETKLFHFHGIFKKIEIKSAKGTPIPLYIQTPFPEILDPLLDQLVVSLLL